MLGKLSKGVGSYIYGGQKKPEQKLGESDNVMPLTADNLSKLQQNPYKPEQSMQPEPFVPTFEIELFNYDDLNQLLHKISTTLV